jgi:hypothetical protein
MSTAFGILLFLIAYGPVAYLIYKDVTGRRSGARPLVARGAARRGLRLTSQHQY